MLGNKKQVYDGPDPPQAPIQSFAVGGLTGTRPHRVSSDVFGIIGVPVKEKTRMKKGG